MTENDVLKEQNNEIHRYAHRNVGTICPFIPKAVDGGVWRIDMTRCPYHDECVRYGCPELCRCFCDSDDITYDGLHPNLVWHRTKTLGRGDDRCDFCMKVMK